MRASLAAASIAAFVTVRPAAAAPTASSAARAEVLYREGRALVAAGHVAEGCAKLAQSHELDPATGTLLNLANCHEREGKLASALAEYAVARTRAVTDGRKDRVAFAEERIRVLEARASVVVLQTTLPTTELTLTIDGSPVSTTEIGAPHPLDPGEHTVQARRKTGETFVGQVVVREPGERHVVAIVFPASPSSGTPKGPPVETRPAPVEKRALRPVTIAVLGTGALVTTVGIIFGARAASQWSDRNAACTRGCTPEGVAAGERAQDSATIANITVAMGLVALAAGTYLLVRDLSAPTKASPSASTLASEPGFVVRF